jgi:UDPglucose--hexose-1-phosphate uridylyltransferase
MHELRRDPVTGRPALIAEGRSSRPNQYSAGPEAGAASSADCPFCEGSEARTPPELAAVRTPGSPADGPGWTVRAIPNKFPSVASDAPHPPAVPPPFEVAPGYGFHEVIVESPRHAPGLAGLPLEQRIAVFRLARDRVRWLSPWPDIRTVLLFENSGPESGGTLFHPHAQIVAMAADLPRVREELDALLRHRASVPGACRWEEAVAAERAAERRWIAETSRFSVFAPFASEHPFGARIVPREHRASFAEATDAEVDELADLLPRLLGALAAEVPGASYNWLLASLAPGAPDRDAYHWQIELVPRLIRPDGFEIGGGIPVNPVPPEEAARRLRGHFEEASRSAPTAPKA